MNMNRIYLTGMSGVGKSTLGRNLAKELNFQFIELDEMIERTAKSTIKDIFAQYGEDYFRDLEHAALAKVVSRDKIVVSVGGGVPMFERNYNLMKDSGHTICLVRTVEEIWADINLANRPLLNKGKQKEDAKENYINLYEKRMPIYLERCNISFNGTWEELRIKLYEHCKSL